MFKPKAEYHLPVDKTLYVDRNFSDFEFATIVGSAWEWHLATNGQVTYEVERLPSQHIDPARTIVVSIVSPDFPEVIELDAADPGAVHMAYFYKYGVLPYIGVVPDRISVRDYRPVMLHELGHSLGLPHTDEFGTLMYPNIDFGADKITDTDLKNFCKLYGCDASKLHDE